MLLTIIWKKDDIFIYFAASQQLRHGLENQNQVWGINFNRRAFHLHANYAIKAKKYMSIYSMITFTPKKSKKFGSSHFNNIFLQRHHGIQYTTNPTSTQPQSQTIREC